MGPQRLDRAELRRRLTDEAPGWVVDELADAFEPAFLTFRRQAEERKRKRAGSPRPDRGERRSRLGRLSDAPEEGDPA